MSVNKHSRSLIYILCLSLVFLWSGCAFFKLEEELVEYDETFGVRGKITYDTSQSGSVLVIMYKKTPAGLQISQAGVLKSVSSQYSMLVQRGTYFIIAFQDVNNNLTYDDNEPVGYYGKPDAIEISRQTLDVEKSRGVSGLDFSMDTANPFPKGFPSDIIISSDILKKDFVRLGELTQFEDERLAQSYGVKGYWEPMTFLEEIGVSILFLEVYDPDKIPVLFIHGALGTPLGWKETVATLDSGHFQPWFYYYPSGLPLNKIGNALNIMVMDLHRTYGFKKLYVVAQSMGGLVARSFILLNTYEENQNFIKRFISISTPWNGHQMTERGVQHAPTAVPSWYDMVPDSDFIQSLFQRKLPPFLEYYLFFSYKGDCSLFLENNDGTVELASELDLRAQAEADKMFGYNEDHGSILYNESVLSKINDLLVR
jgi:uncharacterized alpha/beta hydrolase family protein